MTNSGEEHGISILIAENEHICEVLDATITKAFNYKN